MNPLRSIFAIPVILLLIGAGSIALVWNVTNKWIGLPVFIFGFLCILGALFFLQNLADSYYKRKQAEEDENNFMERPEPSSPSLQKRTYNTASVIFVITLIPFSVMGRFVENYLDWKPIMLHLLIISPVLGMAGYRLWKRYGNVHFEDKEKENTVLGAAVLLPIILAFYAMILTNHFKSSPEIMSRKAFVQRKSKNNNYVFLQYDNKEVRFELHQKDFEKIKQGDSIIIHVKKGGLGYPFVDRFE